VACTRKEREKRRGAGPLFPAGMEIREGSITSQGKKKRKTKCTVREVIFFFPYNLGLNQGNVIEKGEIRPTRQRGEKERSVSLFPKGGPNKEKKKKKGLKAHPTP